MPKMNDGDLLRFLDAESSSAYHYTTGELAAQRESAIRAYLRMPYGNEEEGRSGFIASDVFDSVEGMLPDLVEVFASTDEAVRFDPVGPEDVEGAEQATNACNHVFYKQNNGFLLLYTIAKDALMLKTGGVKWYWEERRTPIFTTRRGTEMQIAAWLTSNPGYEVLEQDDGEPMLDEMTGMEVPTLIVKLKKVEKRGQVRIEAIPPDELRVSRRHTSILLDDAPYVAHVVKRTLSDITQMGYDVDLEDVKAASDEGELAVDAELRDSLYDGQAGWRGRDDDNDLDPSSVHGWLREEYVLVDYDGDGIAERRRIIRLGDKILDNQECSHVQIAAWTPYILTHRFHGMSVADIVADFQKANSDIWRQSFDNLYMANNQETVVLTDTNGNPKANIDDLLNRRPGGIIREHLQGAVRPYMDSWKGIEAIPMLEQISVAKENRTGYTRYSQGLDSNSLNKTAHGLQQIMNASQKRMKLMARIMAEAAVAPMFRGIFKTLTDYCIEKLSFRLNGKFVQYDPQEWRDGYDMSINVGIGAGDKLQQMQMLGGIEAAHMAAVQGGGMGTLVTAKNLYNLQKRKVELAGFKDPGEFWTDPETVQPQPPQEPPPDPKVMMDGAKLQQQAQDSEAERAFKAQQAELDRQHQLLMKQIELAAKSQEQEPKDESVQDPEEDGQEESQTAMALAMMADAINSLSRSLAAPKQIVKDESGRPIGIESELGFKPIVRDENGKIAGLGSLQ